MFPTFPTSVENVFKRGAAALLRLVPARSSESGVVDDGDLNDLPANGFQATSPHLHMVERPRLPTVTPPQRAMEEVERASSDLSAMLDREPGMYLIELGQAKLVLEQKVVWALNTRTGKDEQRPRLFPVLFITVTGRVLRLQDAGLYLTRSGVKTGFVFNFGRMGWRKARRIRSYTRFVHERLANDGLVAE